MPESGVGKGKGKGKGEGEGGGGVRGEDSSLDLYLYKGWFELFLIQIT